MLRRRTPSAPAVPATALLPLYETTFCMVARRFTRLRKPGCTAARAATYRRTSVDEYMVPSCPHGSVFSAPIGSAAPARAGHMSSTCVTRALAPVSVHHPEHTASRRRNLRSYDGRFRRGHTALALVHTTRTLRTTPVQRVYDQQVCTRPVRGNQVVIRNGREGRVPPPRAPGQGHVYCEHSTIDGRFTPPYL